MLRFHVHHGVLLTAAIFCLLPQSLFCQRVEDDNDQGGFSKLSRKKLILFDDHDEEVNHRKHVELSGLFPESYPSAVPNSGDEILWMHSATKLVEMLDHRIYNRFQVPGQIDGKVTPVEVAMYIESMSTFRAQTMDFQVDMYLMMQWLDLRLKHNYTHPIVVNDVDLAQKMWQPDLYFVSSKFSYIHRVTTPNFAMMIYPDGYVMKNMRIDVTLSCTLDLHHFPMDYQQCSAMIQSYAYVESVVNLTWHNQSGYPIMFNPDIKINDMERVGIQYDRCDSVYPLFKGAGRWSCLTGTIIMKRKLEFHIFQIFIPAAMLVVISWLSFWLDVHASAARISLTITTLLTLTTMSNGSRQELPHVPYMKANDIWFTVCQGFVFSVLIEYTMVNYFMGQHSVFYNNRGPKMELSVSEMSKLSTYPLLVIPDEEGVTNSDVKTVSRDWVICAKRVDTYAKIVFPACFLLFIVTYWIYYSALFIRSTEP